MAAAASGAMLPRFVAALRTCGLAPSDRVAVALSGGPDSLALAAMTAWWQGFVRSRHPPLALIVDHRLRPESGEEAAAVAAQAAALGMQARVLSVEWPGGLPPAAGDKMAAAREARYALLLRACGELGRSHLLLAHHAGDQAETFLLRLMHASGVAGLACMPRVAEKRTEFGRVKLVRPLLGFHKGELEGYCQRSGLPYVVDPTNAELSFHRNRIRAALQERPLAPYDETSVVVPPAAFTGGSSGGSSGESGGGGSSMAAAADEAAASGGSSSSGSSSSSSSSSSDAGISSAEGGASIVEDILRLQARCEAAMQRQQALGERLLRRAVVHTSAPGLPGQNKPKQTQQAQRAQQEEQPQRRRTQAMLKQEWLQQQPWYVDWDTRLSQVAYALRGMRYALLDASCFEGLQEPTAVGALARVLQAVAGRTYPPPLPHSMRLFHLLSGGRLDRVFTGGGCLVRRLPRCQGRYVLFISQGDQARAEAQLARLPPLNAAEAARQRRRREQQAAAAAAAGGAGTDEEAEQQAAPVA